MPFIICIVVALSGVFNGQHLSNQYSSAILVLLGIPRQYSLYVILANMTVSAVLGIVNAIFLIERVDSCASITSLTSRWAVVGCS